METDLQCLLVQTVSGAVIAVDICTASSGELQLTQRWRAERGICEAPRLTSRIEDIAPFVADRAEFVPSLDGSVWLREDHVVQQYDEHNGMTLACGGRNLLFYKEVTHALRKVNISTGSVLRPSNVLPEGIMLLMQVKTITNRLVDLAVNNNLQCYWESTVDVIMPHMLENMPGEIIPSDFIPLSVSSLADQESFDSYTEEDGYAMPVSLTRTDSMRSNLSSASGFEKMYTAHNCPHFDVNITAVPKAAVRVQQKVNGALSGESREFVIDHGDQIVAAWLVHDGKVYDCKNLVSDRHHQNHTDSNTLKKTISSSSFTHRQPPRFLYMSKRGDVKFLHCNLTDQPDSEDTYGELTAVSEIPGWIRTSATAGNSITRDVARYQCFPLESGFFEKLFSDKKELGEGSYGIVYEARHRVDQQRYAVKMVQIDRDNKYEDCQKEVLVLAKLKHENIVQYHTAWLEKADGSTVSEDEAMPSENIHRETKARKPIQAEFDGFEEDSCSESSDDEKSLKSDFYLYIKMELCGQTLHNVFYGPDKLTDRIDREKSITYMSQLVSAVSYLHGKKHIHGDLNPRNIFSNPDGSMVKIGDFGMTTTVKTNARSWSRGGSSANMFGNAYISPERFSPNCCTEKTDVYALALIFYAMLAQKYMKTESEVLRTMGDLKKKRILPKDLPVNENDCKCILSFVESDHHKRPNLNEMKVYFPEL